MSVPFGSSDQTSSGERAVSVDLAAFLPDGVELAGADSGHDDSIDPGDDVTEAASTSAGASWGPDLVALDAVEADLDAVDEALKALDDGRYGTCGVCAQPIADDLLAASPTRTTCVAHAPS